MRSELLQIIISLIIITNDFSFAQTTYYVSESGSNSNNGLTPQTAFETLQHASDIVSVGDSVLVLEGNYIGFDIRTDGINIENTPWIEIDGFEINDQPRAGIRIVLSDFVVIQYSYCHNNFRWGIYTGFTDDNITIENNTCSYSEDEHGI